MTRTHSQSAWSRASAYVRAMQLNPQEPPRWWLGWVGLIVGIAGIAALIVGLIIGTE